MRHFVLVAASFVVSASAALAGCVAPADDPETAGQADEAALGDCGPAATPPGYQAPTYSAPTYAGPTYGAPRYTPPVYEAPCYGAPQYQASSGLPAYPVSGVGWASPEDAAPCYEAPTYQAPVYLPPITINIYLTIPGEAPQAFMGPPPGGGCLPGGLPHDP